MKLGLVKNTPHAPGRLFVGVAPCKHVEEGSDVRSETKIFNLDSDEFGSNPPLKNVPPFPFRSPETMGTEVKKKGGKCLVLSGGTGAFIPNSKTRNFKKNLKI